VAVYRYSATRRNREDHSESGTVLARNESEARDKLKRLDLDDIRLKKVSGFSGIWKRISVDVR